MAFSPCYLYSAGPEANTANQTKTDCYLNHILTQIFKSLSGHDHCRVFLVLKSIIYIGNCASYSRKFKPSTSKRSAILLHFPSSRIWLVGSGWSLAHFFTEDVFAINNVKALNQQCWLVISYTQRSTTSGKAWKANEYVQVHEHMGYLCVLFLFCGVEL